MAGDSPTQVIAHYRPAPALACVALVVASSGVLVALVLYDVVRGPTAFSLMRDAFLAFGAVWYGLPALRTGAEIVRGAGAVAVVGDQFHIPFAFFSPIPIARLQYAEPKSDMIVVHARWAHSFPAWVCREQSEEIVSKMLRLVRRDDGG